MIETAFWEFCAAPSADFKMIDECERKISGTGSGPELSLYFANYPSAVGDFSWYLHTLYTITRREIADQLRSRFPEIGLERVCITTSKGTLPKRPAPFQAETYFRLIAKQQVELDEDRTTYCGVNGIRQIIGMEGWTGLVPYDFQTTPRVPGQGLYVRRHDVSDSHFFGIKGRKYLYYSTAAFKDFITERQFSNVGFREVGSIV